MSPPVRALGNAPVARSLQTFGALPGASGRQIVEAHTVGGRTDVPGMAKDLKQAATERPADGVQVLKDALSHVDVGERGELAGRFLGQFSNDELLALQLTAQGRDTLDAAWAELRQANVSHTVARDAQRVAQVLGVPIEVEYRAAKESSGQEASASQQIAKTVINEARKHGPKLAEYREYIEYLRDHQPAKLQTVLNQLQRSDPQTWLALQKHPQFQPWSKVLVGVKAGERNLGAAAGLVSSMISGQFGGPVGRWMEGTLQDMMKRDRFGAYADVLGGKATTLPTPAVSYSNSRLGQFLKVDDAQRAAASKLSRSELERSAGAVRHAASTSASRVLGTALNVATEALNPELAQSGGVILLRRKADTLLEKGVLSPEQYSESRQLHSQGRYGEMQKLMDDATQRFIHSGAP